MKENELIEIFFAEALEGYEELNKLFTILEKDEKNKKAIESVFRITHTLKANAAGMGFEDIAALSHTLEDVFSEIRSGNIAIDVALFNDLFKAIDFLGSMIHAVRNGSESSVKYKGLKTKLEALVRNARFGAGSIPEDVRSKNIKTDEPETKPTEIKTKKSSKIIENKEVESITESSKIRTENAVNQQLVSEYLEQNENKETIADDDNELEEASKVSFSDLVQIPVRKLDNLMNLVGELLIERDRLVTLINGNSRKNEFARLQRITSELQYSVMDVRLVQINVLFQKFHRIVRDVCALENKKVDLVLEGTENEIDRNVLQIISESLVHLVRNAISHGIEKPEDRVKKGKNEIGKLTLSARSEKDSIIIDIKDDGKGINAEVIKAKAIEKGIISTEYAKTLTREEAIFLIFESGLSSAEQITSISGRGVGMDVVKKSIDAIGGRISVVTNIDEGTTISLSLPSSMALKGALLFSLGLTEYAIPLSYTESVIQISKSSIHQVGNKMVANYLDRNISVVFLNEMFQSTSKTELLTKKATKRSKNEEVDDKIYVIVVSYNNREMGFVVDKLHQQKEIVEKPLSAPLDKVDFISGATILGNGHVCLVLDIPSIMNIFSKIK
ncbi:MAG: chemotaxis protein CheA [Bacteroidota bacterium]|nr:chemotaxis protein CheA [Bacteroidota bacterium]